MRIIFAGTPAFAAEALAAIIPQHEVVAVLTQPDRPSGRGMQLNFSAVKQLALQHGIPVLQPQTLKNEDIQNQLKSMSADVMVVAAYGLILPEAVLTIPKHGCLNIHASLLPRWRGAAPIQRAILAGDQETGITIMQMDTGLDTGLMLYKIPCPIIETETAQTLHDKLTKMGADAIRLVLSQLEQGALLTTKQDDSKATYAAKLNKTEAQIDWNKAALEIARAVRAYNPTPVAFTHYKNEKIKIWQAKQQENLSDRNPGQVINIDKNGITVACGKNAMLLEILQRPNSKPMTAQQFVQSSQIKIGDLFI